MEMESFDNCHICMEKYDDNIRPRSLSCGHSFCSSCLNNSVKDDTLVCPHCNKSHHASSAQDFPINYGMEEMISSFRKAQLGATRPQPSGSFTFPSQSKSMKSKLQMMFAEQKECLINLVHDSEEILSHLLLYEEFLLERKAEHEELLSKIYDLAHRNEEMVKRIDTEHKTLIEMRKKGEKRKQVVDSNLASLDTVTSTTNIVTAFEEIEKWSVPLEGWKKSCQKHHPDEKTIRCSDEIVRYTTAALRMVIEEVEVEEDGAATDIIDYSHSSLTIMDKLNRIRGKETLTVTSLQNMSEPLKNLVESGHVYAVQRHKGQVRSAKVTLKDNKTYLHYLQDGEPPVYAHTIQQRDLIDTLKTDSVMAFLDLAWEGSTKGRVHVLLSPDTPLAQHFGILCTGDLGPTYAHSRFIQVYQMGIGSAYIKGLLGGDYELNNGTGGAPLIRGLNKGETIYTRRWSPGLVWAAYDTIDGSMSAQFVIGTSSCKDGHFGGCFGQVEDGLEVVKAAVNLNDVRGVTIADCGVMLPF